MKKMLPYTTKVYRKVECVVLLWVYHLSIVDALPYESIIWVLIFYFPVQLDEEVARAHLEQLGVKLTELNEKQAEYLGVPMEGPYKADYYRY